MTSWTAKFGKQTPRTALNSPVRTRFSRDKGSTRGKLVLAFSAEVMEITGWEGGDLLDLRCDGTTLFVCPSPSGRKLHPSDRTIQFAIDDGCLGEAADAFGFDVTKPQFWELYSVEGDDLVLQLRDKGVTSDLC